MRTEAFRRVALFMLATAAVLGGLRLLGATVDGPVLVNGSVLGLGYALLGAGLVLIYRATRIVNFAHGYVGAFGAVLNAKLVYDVGLPFAVSLPIVLVVGAAVGAMVEIAVVRRLFRGSRLVLLVATIGVAQLLLFAQISLPDVKGGTVFPTLFDRQTTVFGVVVTAPAFLLLAVAPAVVLGITLLLSRTPMGTAIRATAENVDAARLAGIDVRRVSTTVWALAGALAVLTAVLVSPVRGDQTDLAAGVGPALLLRALAAAMVGRLESLPLTFVGGFVVGIGEQVANATFPGQSGTADLFLLVLVLGLLLLRGGDLLGGRAVEQTSLTVAVPPVPAMFRDRWWVRRGGLLVGLPVLALAALVPLLTQREAILFKLSLPLVYVLVALSVTVLTGWAGQLSLGQWAFAGVGAFTVASLTSRGMPLLAALGYAVVAGVVVALVIAAPALRIRGVFLAVVTLAFAVVAQGFLLKIGIFDPNKTGGVVVRGNTFDDPRLYYLLCLGSAAAGVVIVARLRRTGVGRRLVAVRENERATAACAISPAGATLTAFGLSGALAALGGGLWAGLFVRFDALTGFPVDESLRVVSLVVIGGLGSVLGAVLGALFVVGVPIVFSDSETLRLLTSGAGLLLVLLYAPAGLAGLVYGFRRDVLSSLPDVQSSELEEERLQERPSEAPVERAVEAAATHVVPSGLHVTERVPTSATWLDQAPALAAYGVTVRFGGRVALDDVTLEVRRGEVLGLIGSNGAGKSTLMDVLSGFTPAQGRVLLEGTDVTTMSPSRRAKAGLGRAFQDARLFPGMTLRECLQTALERREPTDLVPSLLGLGTSLRAEQRKRVEADELLELLGLYRYAGTQAGALSTGTRRIAELAMLLALDARVLLLDEPTAGVAQAETEQFGPLIRRIQRELDATVVVIEHDIPLVMGMSDRVVCMGAGRVLADGLPEDVRADPAVIASYLGTDERAVQRSGAPAGRR